MRLPQEPRKRRLVIGALVVAFVIGYIVVTRNLSNIDVESLLSDVSSALGAWTYVLVTLFAFLETGAFVGLLVPGETVVILGGAVAGQGETSVILTIALVWAAAFAGDTVSYLIGRRLGRGFVLKHGPRFRISRERFAQVEDYFGRHGGATILIGRFIGVVRALAPFVAGSSGMRYGAMCPYSILGTGLWAATFTLLGFYASKSLNEVVDASGRALFWFAVVVAVLVGVFLAVRFLRVPENRVRAVTAMEGIAVLRPLVSLGRRLRPQARFLRDRITPGGIGLEFTTLIAALAVGLFVLVAYVLILTDDPLPTPGDQTALDLATDIQAGWLTAVVKVITALGSPVTVIVVAAATGVFLCWRRRWTELAALVASLAVLLIAVPELKALIERPRPPDPLVSASGAAYPSGHAAYSIIYPWLALTLAIRLRPGIPGATAIIVGGIALAALIGLSRVYLRVHYLSDVLGGWGLGVSAFAFFAALLLLISQVRQNAPKDAVAGRDPA